MTDYTFTLEYPGNSFIIPRSKTGYIFTSGHYKNEPVNVILPEVNDEEAIILSLEGWLPDGKKAGLVFRAYPDKELWGKAGYEQSARRVPCV